MTTMPTSLEYGYVVGRIILAVADAADADRTPDAVPAAGTTVKLTPKNPHIRITGDAPVLVAKQAITCTLDADGRLLDPEGAPGVWLVTGLYGVTYSSSSAVIPAHDIEVLPAHTEASPLDLTTAMPPGGPVLTPSQYTELNGRLTVLESGGSGNLPVGGAEGQVLAKATAADYDVAWVDPASGGGGAVSSVNGLTGAVVLDAASVGALPDTYTPPAQSWTQITGKPTVFPPDTHTHTTADVTGLATVASTGAYTDLTGTPVIPDTPGDIGAAPSSHTHAVGDLATTGTADGTTFLRGDGAWAVPPSGGGGGAVDSVNGQTGTVVLDAASVGALPDTYTPPAQSWADITGKPTTFTPTAHTHAIADTTGLQDALDGKATTAQGALADTAVQPADLAAVATTGAYGDLTGTPAPVLVLGPADPIPTETAAGTVIVRTTT